MRLGAFFYGSPFAYAFADDGAPFLPVLRERHDMAKIPPSRQTSEGREAARTILIVDDNHDMVGSLAEVLELLGYSTIPAYSAREACDLLDEARNIDLVLSDIRMPDVGGFALLRVLRHRFRSLPIILMSGSHLTTRTSFLSARQFCRNLSPWTSYDDWFSRNCRRGKGCRSEPTSFDRAG